MTYHVNLSKRAQRDIVGVYEYIAKDAPQVAIDFRYGLEARINLLKIFPKRCGLAPEDQHHHETIRQILYRTYRILFIIRDETVYIVHVRHGARREMSPKETDSV